MRLNKKGCVALTDQDSTQLIAIKAILSICNTLITSSSKLRNNFKMGLTLIACKDLKKVCSV
jgi:hypothetical protein